VDDGLDGAALWRGEKMIVVRWKECGFYSELDFVRFWIALERVRAGEAEYESWLSNYTPLL
jgi:hypothetical protein